MIKETQPWSTAVAPIRLRYGFHLYRAPDSGWRIATPDEQFIRLRVAPEQIEALLPALDGQVAPAMLLDGATDVLSDLLEQFGRQGLLEHANSDDRRVDANATVFVAGWNPLAEQVVRLLDAAQVNVRRLADDAQPTVAPTVLLSCAGWLPDRRWQALDAWCRSEAVSWHTLHAEGTHFYLGPMFIPGRTAGYADLRARRLAAAAFPDELSASWRYLESSDRVVPVRWPDTGGCALLAGALVADVLAFLRAEQPASAGFQLAFEPASGTWRRHPVLPIPTGLMRETDQGS
jgi:hypothetical protein